MTTMDPDDMDLNTVRHCLCLAFPPLSRLRHCLCLAFPPLSRLRHCLCRAAPQAIYAAISYVVADLDEMLPRPEPSTTVRARLSSAPVPRRTCSGDELMVCLSVSFMLMSFMLMSFMVCLSVSFHRLSTALHPSSADTTRTSGCAKRRARNRPVARADTSRKLRLSGEPTAPGVSPPPPSVPSPLCLSSPPPLLEGGALHVAQERRQGKRQETRETREDTRCKIQETMSSRWIVGMSRGTLVNNVVIQ